MNKSVIVVSDTGPIISLSVINKLYLLDRMFGSVFIPKAVYDELLKLEGLIDIQGIKDFFKDRVKEITNQNNLILIMDYGESESVILYKEINANFLIIDDKKARTIAESLEVNCIGTLGILYNAKKNGLIKELRPLFLDLLDNNRFYSKHVLNHLLVKSNEDELS